MSIRIEQVTKLYQGVPVVNNVTIEIRTGEFFVLLGPSGSGKSTLLRALAGLTYVDHGRLSLHGREVTNLPARERGVGLVFQNYALFRHMSVADNIEFALRVRRVPRAERRRRRQELLALVALEGYDERFPSQLSGGQQQRVAVARALAHEPAVLLLDEPFGALDARIRLELRETVRSVQRRIGMTTILVTHDQEEAFALGDRIGVMQGGRLLETGDPETLYRFPATRFVARFLGAANLFLGDVSQQGLHLGAATLAPERSAGTAAAASEAVLVVRPEDVELATRSPALQSRSFASGVVASLTFAGHQQHIRVQLDSASGIEPGTGVGPLAATAVTVDVVRSAAEQAAVPLRLGTPVALGVRRVHALPTPISSFRLLGGSDRLDDQLEQSPLLSQLVGSMQARVLRHSDQRGGDDGLEAGICALPLVAAAPAAIIAAAARGARRVLCLAPEASAPTRMLVHAREEIRRSELLALVASVMRHLPVQVTAVTLQPSTGGRGDSPGLELQADHYSGDLRAWIAQLLGEPEPTLLVMGARDADELAAWLANDLQPLFQSDGHVAVLLAIGAGPTRIAGGAAHSGAATAQHP